MRLLVCGGRDFTDNKWLSQVLRIYCRAHKVTVLIHGNAKGADRLAAAWASRNRILVVPFPADWTAHGFSAGPIRNQQMLDEGKPDRVLAFPGGKGTADMIARAKKAQIPVDEAVRP